MTAVLCLLSVKRSVARPGHDFGWLQARVESRERPSLAWLACDNSTTLRSTRLQPGVISIYVAYMLRE